MKCELCKNKIETTFLNKMVGTQVRDKKGKQHSICQACQKANSMDEIKKNL